MYANPAAINIYNHPVKRYKSDNGLSTMIKSTNIEIILVVNMKKVHYDNIDELYSLYYNRSKL